MPVDNLKKHILSLMSPPDEVDSSGAQPPLPELLGANGESPDELWKKWANLQNYPYLTDFSLDFIEPELLARLPIGFLKHHLLLPTHHSDQKKAIQLILGSPKSFFAMETVRTILGERDRDIRFDLAFMPPPKLLTLINNAYERYTQSQTSEVLSGVSTETEEMKDLSSIQETIDLLDARDDAPMIRLANSILAQSIRQKASDIHIEPFEKDLMVRYRVDGVLFNVLSIPQKIQAGLISRFKLMANLNIAEKRLPQDGRIRIKTGGRDIDIRVSTLPVRHGERVVLRILEQGTLLLPLSSIGFDEHDLSTLAGLIRLTHGIILVTGPTGAGKTTTLYAILNTINSPDKNIITIEDPVEYQLQGIGQIQVNSKIQLTFATGLRSILRQDPDVILIGEIRDGETAEIAIQASLTGHLVFSTLHTNDAPSAITRLIDMGTEPFLISTSVKAVIAQRLVRKICPDCRENYLPDEIELQRIGITASELPPEGLFRGKGCARCMDTGYRGRQGIYELLIIDPEIAQLINIKTDTATIRNRAKEKGMTTLLEDGRRKILLGITTTEEVLRVAMSEVSIE
ncbi:MAG: type II secretion system ATPase GspE [Nitrospiraceae bacterium]|jgi:general secretion pathway protein E|nr:type II secretion system ATPase GspE [Nitrospiraceae bacterium]